VGEITAKLDLKTPVEIWFQDEMRLGQKNPRTRRWARRGTRPRAIADLRTKSAYLFGAICAERGTGAAVVMPRADMPARAPFSYCGPDGQALRSAPER
jgi:hypothetical protein